MIRSGLRSAIAPFKAWKRLLILGQDKFFYVNGVRIRYVERGQGEAIVLIHGYICSLETWVENKVFQNLVKDYRVIALDCRGHGKSDKPHELKQYGSQLAIDILCLLDYLNIKKAHLVGYSMGAHLTAYLLSKHCERFLSATLGGAAGKFNWLSQDIMDAEKEASEMERGMLRAQILRLSPPKNLKLTETQIEKISKKALIRQDLIALAAIKRTEGDRIISKQQMAVVKIPTLGIVGSVDPCLRNLQELKKIIPNFKLVIIKGANHGNTLGQPECIETLREFIRDCTPCNAKSDR